MNWQTTDSNEDLPIGELSTRLGLSARTIRYYEELGLLPGVRRRSGGRRVYGESEIERLRFIERLKKLGLALGEIKQLNALYAINGSTEAMLARLGELLDAHLRKLDGRISELMDLREEMGRYREHVGRRIGVLAGHAAESEEKKS